MIKFREMIIATIIAVVFTMAFVLMVEYSLNEELKVAEKQDEAYLKYIEDNKQEGVSKW